MFLMVLASSFALSQPCVRLIKISLSNLARTRLQAGLAILVVYLPGHEQKPTAQNE
jgi:hypothetical protein